MKKNKEKKLIMLIIVITIMFSVVNLFARSSLSGINLEVEKLKTNVITQEKRNQSLTMKISELISFDNISTIANDAGLAYNSSVTIISKK